MNREQILARQRELIEGARAAGRAMTAEEIAEFDSLQRALVALDATPEPAQAAPAENPEADTQRAVEDERNRVAQISDLARSFGMDPAQAITDGTTVDAYRAVILEQIRTERQPLSARATVTEDEGDKMRAAMSDGLMMRAGLNVQNAATGADNFRGTSLNISSLFMGWPSKHREPSFRQ